MIRRKRYSEADCLAEFDPPISLFRPARAAGPIILASPHSGRVYPKSLVARSAQSLNVLRQNEDAYIDEMLGFARHLDIPLLTALFPRCFVDVNREAEEIPVSWKKPGAAPGTARAEMGLGVIPTIIAEKTPIYKKALKPAVVAARLEALYYPYHRALSALIADAQKTFGRALLLDCHSMPGFTQMGQRRPDFVLGDRHGTSCHPQTMELAERFFTSRGYSTARNYPYAGGYVTAQYGNPEQSVEVVQIEINRDLYLNPVKFTRKPGYARLSSDLNAFCLELLRPETQSLPRAAE